MRGVQSPLAWAVAAIVGSLLVAPVFAQNAGRGSRIARSAFFQEPAAEEIQPGEARWPDGDVRPVPEDESILGDPDEFLDDGGAFDSADPAFDDGHNALFPDGMLYNPGRLWYATVQATLLQRQSPQKIIISRLEQVQVVSGVAVPLFPNVLTARSLDFGAEPGLRLTVGRNLYQDIIHRQHALEFTFLGLNQWSTDAFALGPPQISTSTFFQAAGLFTLFPNSVGGFNAAKVHTIFDNSNFNSYELNYRIQRLPRPDRIAQQPDGTWIRQGTPSLVPSFLVGFRSLTFNDNFRWESIGTIPATGVPFSGQYKVASVNNLFGAQVGSDITAQYTIFSLNARGKIGLYGNAAKQHSEIRIEDPTRGDASRDVRDTIGVPAWVGDVGFGGTVRLRPWMRFRASYDFLWMSRIAVAAEQLQFTLSGPSQIRANGHQLFQGVSLGFDFDW
ncbi:MAG: hypothetical protein HYX69_15055 [Planctomycetia bacterium]|nr:hypothetical protein [Planctomycetia bacterium]